MQGARVIIQGFGNAGSYLAKFMHDEGARVVGISDAYGAIYDADGLDINYLLENGIVMARSPTCLIIRLPMRNCLLAIVTLLCQLQLPTS